MIVLVHIWGNKEEAQKQTNTDNLPSTSRLQLVMNTVRLLAATEPDISLRSWTRPKRSLNPKEFWIYIRQVAKNTQLVAERLLEV